MKKFQPNSKLYSGFYDGYTSSDEFIAKKRVYTTNEIPPVSIYKNLHSMLQNDFWKWFVGDTEIFYDEKYNLDTDGGEIFGKDGEIKIMSTAKYTNGIRSLNYGPIPRLVWNKNWKADYETYISQVENGEIFDEGKTAEDFKYIIDNSQTNYNRFEVTGVLEPEKDLMLHEGYRYLSCIYPDHPDYLNILTKNEFDDKIDDSACLIDYKIDIHFMDWLPQYFKYNDNVNKQIAQEDEAAKLKIRNLKNYSFNRKFFGAKEGYKMFAASVFQHASIYSASQYIPLEGGNIGSETPTSVDITWYKEFFDQPEEFTNSAIDKGHYLYKKLFRNIDWQNSSYDFINRYKEPASFYGTAYPTPNSRFVLYEYPNERIIDAIDKQEGRSIDDLYGTIRKDFKEGQKIKVNGQKDGWEEDSYNEGHISYIVSDNFYKIIAKLNYTDDTLVSSQTEEHLINNAITVVGIDTPLQPLYKNFDAYPSNGKILQLISDHDNNPSLIEHDKDLSLEDKWAIHKSDTDVMLPYFQSLEMEQPFYNSTITLESIYNNISEELSRFNEIPEIRNIKVALDPHQNGCIFIAPQQQLSEFEESLNVSLDTNEWFSEGLDYPTSYINYGYTNISDKAILKEGDYLVSSDKKYISTVLGLSNAYLQFSLTENVKHDYNYINRKVEEINNEEFAKYGLVLSLSKNNPEAHGKKVIVFGKPTFEQVTPVEEDSLDYSTKSVYLDVKAIPTTKSHAQMNLIYGNRFTEVATRKYDALTNLYDNEFDSIENDYIKNIFNDLKLLKLNENNLSLKIENTKVATLNRSLCYNIASIQDFIDSADKLLDDLGDRPILKSKALEAYNPLASDLFIKVRDFITDYRNTYIKELTDCNNNTHNGFINAVETYNANTLDIKEAYDADILALNNSHSEKIESIEEFYGNKIIELTASNEEDTATLTSTYTANIAALDESHENNVSELNAKHIDDLNYLNEVYNQKHSKITDDHNVLLNELTSKHELDVDAINNDYNSKVDALTTKYNNNLQNLTSEYNEASQLMDANHAASIGEVENTCNREVQVLTDKYDEDILNLTTEYNNSIQELTSNHENALHELDTTFENQISTLDNEHTQYLENITNEYLTKVNNLYTSFDTLLVDSFNSFREDLSNLSTDLEAPKIKENLEKYYDILREKLDALNTDLGENFKTYSDEDWQEITNSLNDLLVWFERRKQSRTEILESYNILNSEGRTSAINYVQDYNNKVETYNQTRENIINEYNSTRDTLISEFNEACNEITEKYNSDKDELTAKYNFSKSRLTAHYDEVKETINNNYNADKATLDGNFESSKNNLTEEFNAKKEEIDEAHNAETQELEDKFIAAKNKLVANYNSLIATLVESHETQQKEINDDYNASLEELTNKYESDKSMLTSEYNQAISTLTESFNLAKSSLEDACKSDKEKENVSYELSSQERTQKYNEDCSEEKAIYVKTNKDLLQNFNAKFSKQYSEYVDAINDSDEKEKITSKFEALCEAYNTLEELINNEEILIEENISEIFEKAEEYIPVILSSYESRYSQFDTIYDFNVANNKCLNEFIDFELNIKSVIDGFTQDYKNWFIEEIAITYKDLFYKNLLNNINDSTVSITECDNILFNEMLPNKAFLLAPLPADLLMQTELEGDYSYSLLSEQDEFNYIVSFKKNKYDDLLELQIENDFGKKGILTNCMTVPMDPWSFGTINTATLVETHFDNISADYVTEDVALKPDTDKNFLGEYYESNKPWINAYNIPDPQAANLLVKSYKYFDINHDVYDLMHSSISIHKFSYCDPNMLEMFLLDEDKNNIRGEVINYNKVKINCHTVQDSNIISLEELASIRKLDYISTGDQVTGKTVDDDTIVEAIDTENHTLTLNKPMQVTGEFIFTFLCKIEFEPDDVSEDFYNYRIAISKNKEASNDSIFEHGALDTFDYGTVSNHILSSYVDFAVFRESLTDALQEQPYYKENFNLLVRNFYNRYLGTERENDVFVKPSMIETENDIFFELNAYSLLDDDYIMRQEILNYFYQYLNDMTKASDMVHLGVAVNGYTTNDGRITYRDSAFSDDNIHSRFITTDDWEDYEPFYVKVGNSIIPGIFNDKTSENKDDDEEYLGRSLYNEHDDPYGSALYSSSELLQKDDSEKKHYYDIGNPIFKARLGEYEVQKNIIFDDFSSNRVFNTIQFSIMRRVIDSFVDKNKITIANSTISSWNGLQPWPKNCYSVDVDGQTYYIIGQRDDTVSLKDINYLGEWSPYIKDGSLVFPEKPLIEDVLNYYVITNDHDFIINGENISYKAGQIIVWENNKWNVKTFYATGFIGDSQSASKYLVKKFDDESITIGTNLYVTENVDLRSVILIKILNNIGCYTNLASAVNYSYSQLLDLYKNALDFFTGKKTAEAASSFSSEIQFDATCKRSFDESTCYWLQYIGYNNSISEALYNRNFKPGLFITAIYNIDHFEFTLCDISQLLFHFNNSESYISNREYRTLFGINSAANRSFRDGDNYIDRYPFLINEKIESISNNIKLRDYDELVPGSFSSMNRVCIPYTAEGFRYNEDGTISKEKEKIFLTDDYIFVDDENKSLYTYNIINNEPVKFAIHQEQNKYFKNIINNVVEYSKEEILTKDGLAENGTFLPVSGFDFDGAKLSLNDRILSLKPIDIRSAYSLYLEPRLFSKYTTIKGTLKGIISDSEDEATIYGKTLKWNISNEFNTGIKEYLNRVSFASMLNNLRPANKAEDNVYQDDTLLFDVSSFEEKTLAAPKITKVDVLDKISTENGVTYYKNNLIIEGTIDESDPTVINFGSTKSIDALNNIQVGDRILEIASLSNGSNTFNQINAGLNGIRFIDYRNNKLLVCADSGMKVREMTEFTIENVNKISLANTQNYIVDGEDLTNTAVPSMLLWDNDLETWILALKSANSENGLGMYYISFGENNTINLTKITEDLEKDEDFNKFQLINPYLSENINKLNNSSNKLLSQKYGNYRMLARDLAIREIDDNINSKPSRVTVNVEYNNSDGVITPKTDIKEYTDQPRNYIELDCTVSNSTENTTLKLKEDKAYWLFDNKIGKWIFYQTNKGSEIHIGNQGRDSVKLRLYYVSYNVARNVGIDESFETDAWGFKDAVDIDDTTQAQGEFLWKLPRPVNEDEIIAVQIETESSYAISKNTEENTNREYSIVDVYAKISDATISNISITTKDILNIGTDDYTIDELELIKNKTNYERLPYVTGPYVPYLDKTKVIRGCSNTAGYEAVLVGSNIFIKSPTKLWVSDDQKHYVPTSQTEEFFWKRAKLPRLRDISQGDISNMTIEDAYLKVSAMRQFILDDLKVRAPESSLYIWLNNNEIAHYTSIDDIPTQISLNDVTFTITSNGIRPTYYVGLDSENNLTLESKVYNKAIHFENYIAAEDIDLSLGYTSKVYLKEQMYLSYLKDFYEIILGCNNVSDLFEEGIKDVKMTDTSLIITSYNNIIMSLSLEKTTSRDDIENMNNWNMLSIDSKYEIPYCDTYSYQSSDYIYSDNKNGIINYNYGPKLKTFFAYKLDCSYIKDNIQVYGGTLDLDNHAVEDYVTYLKSHITKDELDYSWMDAEDTNSFSDKHLFIAYSSDNGRTFQVVDLKEAGIQIPSTGAAINSIYRIDDVIRVLYNKGEDQIYYYDITISDNDLVESLIEKEYIESDKEYKLMNKNFYIGGGYECLINSPVEQNSFNSEVEDFIISMPGTFAGGAITSKSVTSIRYNPNRSYETEGSTTNVKVLLAIQTSNQIYDQFKYLDYKEEYFNIQGDLRVSETEEVENASIADRAFSLNETLPLTQESIYSIPSLAVDTGLQGTHRIYKYNISLKADSDEIIYSPVTMTNFEGNEIYLCGFISQEEGKRFLIYRNQLTGNSTTFKEILSSYNEHPDIIDNIQRMYAINEEYEFSVNDSVLTEMLNKYTANKNFLLKEIYFADTNPHIINTTSEDTDEDIINIHEDYFLKWPTIDGTLCEKLCGPLGLDLVEYDDYNTSYGLKEFLEKLQLLEKEMGNLTDEVIGTYFKPIKVYYAEDNFFYGVYEVYSSTILMTERVIKETVSMTYEFGSIFNYLDNSVLTNKIDKNESGLSLYTSVLETQYDENSPINAISINSVGYGSSISNKKWDKNLPQDIDPEAWIKDTLLFNSNGEPIFLCDENGNNIMMRKGLFYGEKGNIYTVSHDNLYAEDSVIDIFDGNLIDNKSTFHFYSLPESAINIWTPFNKIDFSEKVITPFRVYRGGVLITKEEFDENYTLSYSPLYKADFSPYIGLLVEFDGDKLSFNDAYNGNVIVENDIFVVTIKDNRSGTSASIELEVENNTFKVKNSPTAFVAYSENDTHQVVYSINRELSKYSIPDSSIECSMSKNNGITSLALNINGVPNISSIIIYDNDGNSENLNLDIAKIDPILYVDRDWISDSLGVDGINCKVYSKDVDITDRYIITRTNEQIRAVCKYSTLSILIKNINQIESNINEGDIDYNNKFVYSYGETNTFIVNRQKDFLIRGLFGQVILLAPAFKNFKDLIYSLGRMIDTNVNEIYNDKTSEEKVSIIDITTSKITIDHLLETNAPYLRVKLMPVSSVTLASNVMNNEDYYTEISIDDIDFYGYDRVCINENVFMAPPLKVNDQYFNTESVSQYSIDSWKNKDGLPVYLANENGKYVKGFISNHKLNYKVIGDEFGNCSQEIYQSVNPRLNPTELIYKTAYDYYYNTYYSNAKRSNPFFRFLKINQNIIGENIVDEIGLYQQIKEDNRIVLKKDENFKIIHKILLDLDLNKTHQLNDIVNEKEGELNYIITCKPSSNEYDYLAGIKYKNYMYDSDIVSDKKYCIVDSDLIAKFTILSKEDLTNKEYKPIVDITEVGIFSKEGYLLAYMHHPIVQYDTKLNHLSYNLVIENK